MPPQILLVDDDEDLVWALRYGLQDEGYGVLVAHDGLEALRLAEDQRPDLVILDIVMPRLDGWQVCQRLRRHPSLASVPILFLTARSAVGDRVRGLDDGGDDYLAKPFEPKELKARIRALLRRAEPRALSPVEQNGDAQEAPAVSSYRLVLDIQRRCILINTQAVQLTPTEFELLHYLMSHPGQLFGSQDLLHHALNYHPVPGDSSLVRWHIRNLRQKIEADPAHPTHIRTIPHQGYVFENRPRADQTAKG